MRLTSVVTIATDAADFVHQLSGGVFVVDWQLFLMVVSNVDCVHWTSWCRKGNAVQQAGGVAGDSASFDR